MTLNEKPEGLLWQSAAYENIDVDSFPERMSSDPVTRPMWSVRADGGLTFEFPNTAESLTAAAAVATRMQGHPARFSVEGAGAGDERFVQAWDLPGEASASSQGSLIPQGFRLPRFPAAPDKFAEGKYGGPYEMFDTFGKPLLGGKRIFEFPLTAASLSVVSQFASQAGMYEAFYYPVEGGHIGMSWVPSRLFVDLTPKTSPGRSPSTVEPVSWQSAIDARAQTSLSAQEIDVENFAFFEGRGEQGFLRHRTEDYSLVYSFPYTVNSYAAVVAAANYVRSRGQFDGQFRVLNRGTIDARFVQQWRPGSSTRDRRLPKYPRFASESHSNGTASAGSSQAPHVHLSSAKGDVFCFPRVSSSLYDLSQLAFQAGERAVDYLVGPCGGNADTAEPSRLRLLARMKPRMKWPPVIDWPSAND